MTRKIKFILDKERMDEINHKNENPENKQRTVNKNLGKNITKDHMKIYDQIEENIGKTKKCTFGKKKGSKTGVIHEGDENVPIRDFELKAVSIDENNHVIIEKGDGLQGFCRKCSKLRRRVRLDTERKEKKDMTEDEIHQLYIQKYKINTKKCSRCENHKELFHFSLSISMECGLHNVCKLCSCEYGSSVGDRWIIYMPDGDFKYDKSSKDMHDDHIFPLSLGGSNEKINHQLLSAKENLEKSNDLQHFETIENINPELLCERYRKRLTEATNLQELKIILHQSIYDDILQRSKLTDEELMDVYKLYCQKYNLRRNIKRAVQKFRDYCKLRIQNRLSADGPEESPLKGDIQT